jgi:transcriptional regulator with XRE-family HTH domain
METNKVGLFIQECRKKQNMTQSDLAKALHVTDQAVSKWERGLNYPDIGLLSDLADLLKVSVSEILKGEISMSEIKTEEAVKEVLEYSDAVIKKEKNYFTKKLMVLRIMIALIISALLNVYFEETHPRYTTTALSSAEEISINRHYHGLEFMKDWVYCSTSSGVQLRSIHQATLFGIQKEFEGFQLQFPSGTNAADSSKIDINKPLISGKSQGGTLLWTDLDQYPDQTYRKGIPYFYPIVRSVYDEPQIQYWIYDISNGKDPKTLKLYARFSAVYQSFRTDGQAVTINGTTAIITINASEINEGKRTVPATYLNAIETGLISLMMQVGDSVLLSDLMDVNAHQFEYIYRIKMGEYSFSESRSTVYDASRNGLFYTQTFTSSDGTVTFSFDPKGGIVAVDLLHDQSTQSVTSILNTLNLLVSNDLELWPVNESLLDKVKERINTEETWIIEDGVTVICIQAWGNYRITWPTLSPGE